MKKVLVCALAVFFLMASCSTAFAAATTTTTTAYVSGNPDEMTVTTTVEGAAEGSMYTFLVTDDVKSDNDKTNVVAADQQTIDTDGTAEFTYTGKTTAVTSLVAYSGNNVTASLTTDNTLTRTVTIAYEGATLDNTTLILPAYVSNETTIPFTAFVPYNKKITSVKVGGTDLGYANGSIKDSDFADDATLTVTLEDATESSIDTDTIVGRTFWRQNGDEVLTVFAKIKSLIPDTEFGIELQIDNGAWTKYVAKGCGSDGSFAVQLINKVADGLADNADFYNKSVKARVYYGGVFTEAITVEQAGSLAN